VHVLQVWARVAFEGRHPVPVEVVLFILQDARESVKFVTARQRGVAYRLAAMSWILIAARLTSRLVCSGSPTAAYIS
jgi:hypothetical protein